MSRLSVIPLLAILVALAPLAASGAEDSAAESQSGQEQPAAGPGVAEIRVTGNRRVEGDAVRTAMKTKVGAPLDSEVLAADLRRIWALGFFSDVQLAVDDSDPSKPVVLVKLEEKPAVRSVT